MSKSLSLRSKLIVTSSAIVFFTGLGLGLTGIAAAAEPHKTIPWLVSDAKVLDLTDEIRSMSNIGKTQTAGQVTETFAAAACPEANGGEPECPPDDASQIQPRLDFGGPR